MERTVKEGMKYVYSFWNFQYIHKQFLRTVDLWLHILIYIFIPRFFSCLCLENFATQLVNSCTCLWLFTRSLARSQHFVFFALHSLLMHFRQCLESLQLKCQWTVAIKLFLVALRPILTIPCCSKHSAAICRVPQIIVFCSLQEVCTSNLDEFNPLVPNILFF